MEEATATPQPDSEWPPPLQPQLPYLIFPRADGEAPTIYSATTGKYDPLGRIPDHLRRAAHSRFCGSADGGWVVLALESSGEHELYNLYTGIRITLPARFISPTRTDQDSPLVVRVATLSGTPNSGKCMVAAIAQVGRIVTAAFWRQGSESWFTQGDLTTAEPQDVIWYKDCFLLVTSREEFVALLPLHGSDLLRRVDYKIPQRADYDMPAERAIKRYLLESRQNLLMVVRYIFNKDGTDEFRVFALRVSHECVWEDLGKGALDGRVLFLGAGCSRTFEVADYYGLREESTICFLDDGLALAYTSSPEDYSTDMGRYFMKKATFQLWPPDHPPTSGNAPPTWWLD